MTPTPQTAIRLQVAAQAIAPDYPELADPRKLAAVLERGLCEPATAPAAPPPRFLTPEAAADLAGVHPRTLLGWIRSKGLPAKKLGRRTIRIAQADLLQFLRGEG